MNFIKPSVIEFCEPAGTRKVERHISCAGRHLVSTVLHYTVSGSFQYLIGRGRHKSMSARTLIFHPNEYLHYELFAPFRLTTTYGVHVLEILASSWTITSMIAHQRPQWIPFLLMF